MAIDAETVSDNSSADATSADTGSAAPASADTQSSSAPTDAGSAAAPAQPAKADTRAAGAGSSTNPNATSQNTQPTAAGSTNRTTTPGQPAPAAPVDWQKRYSELQQQTQLKINQTEARQRQFDAEVNRLRSFEQQQRQLAEQQKLKPWSKQHPDNTKFQSLMTRAQTVRQQLNGIDPKLPPEQQELARNAIMSALTPEDQTTLQEYQQESQQFQREFFVDPRGTLAPMLRQEIQQAFDQFRLHQQAQTVVDKDFAELKPVLEQHGPEMASMLQRGTPYEVAVENLRLKAQLGALQSRVGDVEKANGAAVEQQRLAKSQASITRDPVPASRPNIYEMAKKEAAAQGIDTGSPRFMQIVSRIEQNLKKTSP